MCSRLMRGDPLGEFEEVGSERGKWEVFGAAGGVEEFEGGGRCDGLGCAFLYWMAFEEYAQVHSWMINLFKIVCFYQSRPMITHG